MKNKISENRGEFIREASKIVPEWNCHLQIFSRPQVIENSRQILEKCKGFLSPRTKKTVCNNDGVRIKRVSAKRSSTVHGSVNLRIDTGFSAESEGCSISLFL